MRHKALSIMALLAGLSALTIAPPDAESQGGGDVVGGPAQSVTRLDLAERKRVIDGVISNLELHYFDRDIAKKTADALLAHENDGEYNTVTDGATFASVLTKDLRDGSGDMHLMMDYSPGKLPDGPPPETPESRARYRSFMETNHCFFKKAEMLPHRIGYLKFDWFGDPAICGKTLTDAMATLNGAQAMIYDLRDNGGGDPSATIKMAAYLFDHPEYWYSPRSAPTEESWTRSPVAGNELADKPVYVLTSSATWSGAEQFCYDLKMLRRATLVGETTRGGAHAGVFHRIDDHFGIGIPESKPLNPYGKSDWEGVGVTPDVRVNAAAALETAVKLAEAKLLQGCNARCNAGEAGEN